MSIGKILLVTFGVLIVGFCVRVVVILNSLPTYQYHRPLLDLQDSHLMTPRGPISFEFRQGIARYPADENSAGKQIFVLVPAFEDFPVLFIGATIFADGVSGSSAHVTLATRPSDPNSDNVLGNFDVQQGTYYQLNHEAKEYLSVTNKNGSQPTSTASLTFNWPKPLSEYDIGMQGNSMSNPNEVLIIKSGESNSHYLYLPFTIGGAEFSIHLRFRVSVNSYESIIGN